MEEVQRANVSIHDRISEARRLLRDAGFPPDAAVLDAEVLARHALGWDRADVLTRGREPEPDDFAARYSALIARRRAREPVALIVGRREFWGLDFEVTGDVLVPRPETEFVVEEALTLARSTPEVRTIIDVGTGSGCLAVVLARELPATRVIATDISGAALHIAHRNAERHGLRGRIQFVRTDLLAGITTVADLMVSNPPYVPRGTALQPDVARYEPAEALFGGRDGFEITRRLLADAPRCLAPAGRLVFEFGDGQEDEARRIAEGLGWHILRIRNDLQGLARVAVLGREA
jgi:release factor glutamine methyltransferase